MKRNPDLAKKLRALEGRIEVIKAVMTFLKKHPVVPPDLISFNLAANPV